MEEKTNNEVIEPEVKQEGSGFVFQEDLPNATMVLTMGILSIVLGLCCCGPFALPLAIIGWVKGQSGVSLYQMNPTAYTASSYSNMKVGKICSIIGFILILLSTVWTVYALMSGIEQVGGWDAYLEMIKEAAENAQ